MAATQIKFPRHSFVNDSSVDNIGSACDKPPFCLPAAFLSDWRFQVFITDYGTTPAPMTSETRKFYVGITDQACTGEMPLDVRFLSSNEFLHIDFDGDTFVLQDGTVVKGVLLLNVVPNTIIERKYQEFEDGEWQAVITEPIALGECFSLTIWEDIIAEDDTEITQRTALGCTNCFVKTETDCFFSRFIYSNNENSNGFIYRIELLTFQNFGLLPFHLHSPAFPSEEKSYTKSNGAHIKLYERTDEELTLETSYFDMRVHKCMKVMLGSDNISISNDYFAPRESSDVLCREEYSIEWDKLGNATERVAKATTKVISLTPISMINNNCR